MVSIGRRVRLIARCTWPWGTALLAGPPEGTHGAQVQAQTQALGQGQGRGRGWIGMGMETGLARAGLTILAQHQHLGTAGTRAQVLLGKCRSLPCPGAINSGHGGVGGEAAAAAEVRAGSAAAS